MHIHVRVVGQIGPGNWAKGDMKYDVDLSTLSNLTIINSAIFHQAERQYSNSSPMYITFNFASTVHYTDVKTHQPGCHTSCHRNRSRLSVRSASRGSLARDGSRPGRRSSCRWCFPPAGSARPPAAPRPAVRHPNTLVLLYHSAAANRAAICGARDKKRHFYLHFVHIHSSKKVKEFVILFLLLTIYHSKSTKKLYLK